MLNRYAVHLKLMPHCVSTTPFFSTGPGTLQVQAARHWKTFDSGRNASHVTVGGTTQRPSGPGQPLGERFSKFCRREEGKVTEQEKGAMLEKQGKAEAA